MSEQLALIADAKPKRVEPPGPCTCLHQAHDHQDGVGRCMWTPAKAAGELHEAVSFRGVSRTRSEWRKILGLDLGACKCVRFDEPAKRGKRFAPNFERPDGCVVLKRPDTVRFKEMGWAIFSPTMLVCYLEQFRPKTPNAIKSIMGSLWRHPPAKAQGIVAGINNEQKSAVIRAAAAIECCYIAANVLDRGRPVRIVLTRVSTGSLDDDGLIGSMKYIRDGVAEALLVDDAEFSIGGEDPSKIMISYRKANPGKRGAYGTQIELFWT